MALPRPVSVCRYFHRLINLETLIEVGFSPKQDVEAGVKKYALPPSTDLEGLRGMEEKDVDQVVELWARYSRRYDMVLHFDRREISHWLVPQLGIDDENRVIWSYVVEVRGSILAVISPFLIFLITGREQEDHRLLLVLLCGDLRS